VANAHDQVTVSETITKYRSLIMDNVLSGNKAKVKALFDDITKNVDNKNYITPAIYCYCFRLVQPSQNRA